MLCPGYHSPVGAVAAETGPTSCLTQPCQARGALNLPLLRAHLLLTEWPCSPLRPPVLFLPFGSSVLQALLGQLGKGARLSGGSYRLEVGHGCRGP